MYLTPLKTGLTMAVRKTFNEDYPEEKLRGLKVGIEYPIEPEDYPGVWVNFVEALLQVAGIDHVEINEDGTRVLRWRFEGHASYTIAAMSSLERDLIFDELVKVVAFARSSEATNVFRKYVETNNLIAMTIDFDQIEVAGDQAVPGTPWETDEMIYERSLGMQVIGEFTTNVDTGTLVPLTRITIQGRQSPSTEESPLAPINWNIDGTPIAPTSPAFDPGAWH